MTMRICIDPGRGGRDRAVGQDGLLEKDVNLAVAKRVAKPWRTWDTKCHPDPLGDEYVSLGLEANWQSA